MDMNIVTLPKKDLKTRPYSMDMNKEDHIVTLPKTGLTLLPVAFYDFLSYGGEFLSHTPENNVKII